MKRAMRLLMVMAALVVLLAAASPAKADSFTVSNALGNCFKSDGVTPAGCLDGLTYTLSVSGSGPDYTVTLTIVVDSTFVAPGGKTPVNAVSAVNFDVSSGAYTSQTLTSAPTGDPSLNWTTTNNSLNSSGCGTGSTNFVCSEASAGFFAPLTPGTTLTWTWDITVNPGNSIFPNDLTGGHIGVKHNNINGGVNGNLLSYANPGTAVPEPGTMALFGTGLLGLAGVIRRRMNS